MLGMKGFSQTVRVASGGVLRFEKFASAFVEARNVDVWLPDGYHPNKKYAVLYMHDGQMLFDSTTTWNHQEWKVDETAGRLMKEQKTSSFLVVGIWNNGEKRREEYFPQGALPHLIQKGRKELHEFFPNGPMADNYLRFLVKELKPFIDSNFSTLQDAPHTFIAGSSMGGLISMYAVCEFPEVFGGAACLSTHWTGLFRAQNNPVPAAILKYFQEKLPPPGHHKWYFDCGDQTLDSLYPAFQKMADDILIKKGYDQKNWTTRFFPGEDHSERAWARRFSYPLEFLLGR
jgi:enterochelin esterase-like enzyme